MATGAAPDLPGVFAGADWDQGTALFISHLHLDHTSLVAFVHPEVPLFYPAAMEPVRAAAVAAGYLGWRDPAGTPLGYGETVHWGELEVTCLEVDHDLPGAAGYLLRAPDLSLAFSGDQRRHGLHSERIEAFCAAVRGVDVLVQEGVTLGFESDRRTSERQVVEGFREVLSAHPGLVVVNLTSLNRERVAAFAAAAADAGRRFVMEPADAVIAGRGDALTPEIVSDARARPGAYVLQLGFASLPLLIDLEPPPGSAYVHSNGPPLGPYDPAFGVMEAWAVRFGLELVWLGSTGHSYPEDVARTVREVAPGLVIPVHTAAPQALEVDGVPRLIPEVGRVYGAAELRAAALTQRGNI